MQQVYVSSGGGIRIGATFGAIKEGEKQGKFFSGNFDTYIGTSAGSLDAVMTANGWDADTKIQFFIETDFEKLFTPFLIPFGVRKAATLVLDNPIKLKKLSDLIDSLNFDIAEEILVNTVDSLTNQQIVYCEKKPEWWPEQTTAKLITNAFSQYGFGKILTRSMVLPGLEADDPRYMDGGIAENPFLSALPVDSEILFMHLGYAGDVVQKGDTVPKGLLSRSLYAYEHKATTFLNHMIQHYPNLKPIYPKIYNVDSSNFALSKRDKKLMVQNAQYNCIPQWKQL